jgi:hypothetical protein
MEIHKGVSFRQAAVGAAPIAAGVLLVAGMAVKPPEESGPDQLTAYYTSLVADPTAAQVSTILIGFAFLLFVPALLGMAQLTRHRATRLGNAGWALGTVGFGTMAGMTMVLDIYDTVLAQELGVAGAVAISQRLDQLPSIAIVGMTAGVGSILGLLLMAAALWRSGQVPTWGAAALAIGALGLFLSPSALPPLLAATSVLLLGCTAIGMQILRARDWEPAGPVLPAVAGTTPSSAGGDRVRIGDGVA